MRSFSRSVRYSLVAGAAVLVLAGSAVGIAAAQTQPTPATAQQTQNGYQAFIDALAKRLNTSTSNLQTAISEARTDAGLPAGNEFPGRGGHRRGPGRPEFAFRGFDPNTAAQAVGISADQLRTELPGKSLAQVAQAHGKSANDVATALKNAAHTRLDERIDQLVNEVMPQPPLP